MLSRARLCLLALLAGAAASPSVAQARVFVGFGFGYPGFYTPFYAPPPVYYAPPVFYPPPPPVVYAPEPYTAPSFPATPARCYAGAYVCPLDRAGPVGAPCSCPGDRGRVTGRIG